MTDSVDSGQVVPAVINDDDRLDYTQNLRRRLIDNMTENGTKFPEDKGEKMVLLAALGDMDRTALAKKKIGSQERQGALDREAATMITAILTRKFDTPSGSPLERPLIEGEYTAAAPELDTSALPPLQLVPGETAVGLSSLTYKDFMAKMDGQVVEMSPAAENPGT